MRHLTRLIGAGCAALATVLCIAAPLPAQDDGGWAVGSWEGTLSAGGQEIGLVYHISRADDGTLTGTMDVPSQGASDIPLNDVAVDDSTLSMTFPVPGGGSYEGELAESGDEIRGTYSQGPNSFPLDLERAEADEAQGAGSPDRPQEPRPPLPYDAEEVTFSNEAGGIELAGTVTTPTGDGPFPGVVLVSGAGAQDRDGTMFGHKPLLVLADHLTRRGVAVLRFDDRGTGGSGGDFAAATPEDVATDALAAVSFLADRPSVAADGVGVVGHSHGALSAAMAARRSDAVAFVVMLAGPGLPGMEVAGAQAERMGRATGTPEAIVELNRRVYTRLAEIAVDEPDPDAAASRMRAAMQAEIQGLPTDLRRQAFGERTEQVVDRTVRGYNSPWARFTLRFDPRPTLEELQVPVLALIGEKDLQLDHQRHLPEIAAALRRGDVDDVSVRALPGLNHFLQEAETGSPAEYARLEQTVSPTALEVVSSWIGERFTRR